MTYLVWCPEYGESIRDAQVIEAYDAAMAAAEYVAMREREESDYPVAEGHSEMRVRVRAPGDSDREYVVTGEAVPHYRAELSSSCV